MGFSYLRPMQKQPKIWFITGVSGGLGLALMQEVLKTGDIVIGTVRKEHQLQSVRELHPANAKAILLDVTDFKGAKDAVASVIRDFGRIDVLVNNAGFGVFGAIEELTLEECRVQMETNVFGVIHLTQCVLPFMRKQKSGAIVQLSSIAGIRAAAGLGIYNASKFALEGLSEALYHELLPLNIKVLLVEPGPFRTEFAGTSAMEARTVIEDYDSTAGAFRRLMHERNGTQIGDPVKGSQAIIKALHAEVTPLRLPLGRIAMEGMLAKMDWVKKEITAWETTIVDTDIAE